MNETAAVSCTGTIGDEPLTVQLRAPGYDQLAVVLGRAFQQAAAGKGNERHSRGQPFHEQPIVRLQDLYGTGFAFGQVAKKMEEAQRLPPQQAVAELLGGINYLAAAVLHIEAQQTSSAPSPSEEPNP